MEFTNSFTVNVPLEHVWKFMLDADSVTPCVPGAAITEKIDDTHYKGTVKVKLGAVQMSYRGEMEMAPDESAHVIVLRAKGTEMRGSGGASGTVTTTLREENGITTVEMASQVDVTGRVAQFGRGIMQDVSNRLIKDFARCLETKLTADREDAQEVPVEAESAPQVASTTSSSTVQGVPDAVIPSYTHSPVNAPAPSGVRHGVPATEIRPMQLLLEVVRSRIAQLLRVVASKIEPQ